MPLPSKKELKTTLEVFALFQWALSAFLIATTVFGFNLYLVVFTSYWTITVLILTWLAFDWKTPERGGRRFTCVRHWCLWKQYCDYFPMKLLKTYDISPSHNYILISQPHGIMSHSSFGNFATESTGFSKIFPGITPYVLTLGAFFWVPFLREYIMSLGVCSVSQSSMDFLLTHKGTGNMLILVVGGLAECQYRKEKGVLRKWCLKREEESPFRTGVEQGVALIPAYNFGETDLYDQYIFTPGGLLVSCLQKWVKSMVHIYPCAFYGHGFTKNSWGLLPYDRPVTTIVGEPLPMLKIENPSQETMAKFHALYIDALRKLFNQHKTKFGISEAHELVLV
ncbi:LOW QUALITY PROTEIN: acyl-CoA wax alcohol acyltransferase 2 [Dasypus novemcinctus]|uniref:LOW QUALITY PROTEIN: acyl-CoA wax alcohol acyltransferase 2 n=1 Tax=Dasypus novemcinctus TaxID=9361 RepID=UPI0003291763|nr:LOW QUALITY PROTEIN: acyl-CoA wax alcohol acyltransferase 2 [Dasypus novemcinctus]